MNSETAMAIHEMLGEGYRPVDFLTARGTHMGCGECCSRMLPVTDGELKVLKDAVRERGIVLRPEMADVDLTCPLLDDGGMCMLRAREGDHKEAPAHGQVRGGRLEGGAGMRRQATPWAVLIPFALVYLAIMAAGRRL